jgi:hypothetical protein
MKALWLVLLVGSLHWSESVGAERLVSGPASADSIDYAIYSRLIDQHYGRTIHRPVVVDASTIGGVDRFVFDDSFRKMLAVSLSPLSPESISSYESTMARSALLEGAFGTTVPCRVVSQAALDTIFSQCPRGWEILSARFPGCGGYVTLSNVGRDSAGSEALVYTEDHCGVLCGEGTFVYLRRGDEGWRVEKKLTVWVE